MAEKQRREEGSEMRITWEWVGWIFNPIYAIDDFAKQNSNHIQLLGNSKVDDLVWEEFLDKQINSINHN